MQYRLKTEANFDIQQKRAAFTLNALLRSLNKLKGLFLTI